MQAFEARVIREYKGAIRLSLQHSPFPQANTCSGLQKISSAFHTIPQLIPLLYELNPHPPILFP